jgi:hypothetical protein
MNAKLHLLLLFALALSIGLGRIIGKDYYNREFRQVEAKANLAAIQKVERGWRALSYTNAPLESLADHYFEAIKWDALNLTALQKDKLKNGLREVFRYFDDPTVEKYFALKAAGVDPEFTPSPRAVDMLNKNGYSDSDFRASAWETVQTMWTFLWYLSTLANPPSCGCLGLTGMFDSSRHDAVFGIF